jgi:Chaperone of endosialidase
MGFMDIVDTVTDYIPSTRAIKEVAGGGIDDKIGGWLDRSKRAEELYGGVDPQGRLANAAQTSSNFGRRAAQNYAGAGRALDREQRDMRALSARYGQMADRYGRQFGGLANQYGRIARGEDSISAEQLRQGLQQNQATQMSMAAGAAPQNAAMAARTAMMNAGRMGAGMSGQAAMAGLQERRDALGAQLGAMNAGAQARQGFMGGQAGLAGAMQQGILSGRGQDITAALGGQQGALQGFGGLEQARTDRYGKLVGAPTAGEHIISGLEGGGKLFAAMSDKRLKKDIRDGDDDAEELLKGLRAYTYKYRDQKHGKGEFTGPMAQDLERSRAGRAAVIETPEGKAVHGARLALALAGAAGNLHRRLSKLEGKGE